MLNSKRRRTITLGLLSQTSVEIDRKEMKKTQKQTFEYELRRDMTGFFGVELVVGEKKSRFHDTKRIFSLTLQTNKLKV